MTSYDCKEKKIPKVVSQVFKKDEETKEAVKNVAEKILLYPSSDKTRLNFPRKINLY